jgi:imidazole glycerol-phosphate synthase subunit HisH
MKTVIVDYGSGNANSLKNAFDALGVESSYSFETKEIRSADKLILPGIGHHGTTMTALKELNLIDVLNHEVLISKKPVLGICLGMQLMTNFSEEGSSNGFGWIDANTKRIQPENTKDFKVPHVGWNLIESQDSSPLLSGLSTENEPFYFCNTYAIDNIDAKLNSSFYMYDKKYIAHFESNNIFGVQFHPEKSHGQGMALLKNFLEFNNIS